MMQNNEDSAIRIVTPTIFSFEACLNYMDNGYNDCMYSIENKRIRKAIYVDCENVLFQIGCDNDSCLTVTILTNNVTERIKKKVEEYVIAWFDLKRDITPFYHLLEQQDETAYMVKYFYGLRLIGFPDLYEVVCWCIIGQLINLSFAHQIKRNIVDGFGESIQYQGKKYYLFPKPEVLCQASSEELKSMKLTSKKAECLIEVSRLFTAGAISQKQMELLSDLKRRQQLLLNIKGIGIWTTNYSLLKCLKQPDCIPYGDAVLVNALIKHQVIENKNDINGINSFYNRFPEWSHYLTFYFWRSR